jgi:hypothetical protein
MYMYRHINYDDYIDSKKVKIRVMCIKDYLKPGYDISVSEIVYKKIFTEKTIYEAIEYDKYVRVGYESISYEIYNEHFSEYRDYIIDQILK